VVSYQTKKSVAPASSQLEDFTAGNEVCICALEVFFGKRVGRYIIIINNIFLYSAISNYTLFVALYSRSIFTYIKTDWNIILKYKYILAEYK